MIKSYVYRIFLITITLYSAIQFTFYPELTSTLVIRFIGGLFFSYTIEYALDINERHLQKK